MPQVLGRGHRSATYKEVCKGLEYCNYVNGHQQKIREKEHKKRDEECIKKLKEEKKEKERKQQFERVRRELFAADELPPQTVYAKEHQVKILKEQKEEYNRLEISPQARKADAICRTYLK